MIEKLIPQIKGLILDMDGVLLKGSQAIIDIGALFERVNRRGLSVVLATNNATREPAPVIEGMEKYGVKGMAEWQVVTSAMVVTYLLQKRFPNGGPVYVVGEQGLVNSLKTGGFYPAEENVLAVIAGLDRTLTYEKIKRATILIRGGALFYGTNPDKTFPTQHGLVPGAGSILAAIEAACGVEPILAGKPQPGMFELALERMKLRPDEALAVGDRLDTDILGGQRAGCRTALVLSGVSTAEQAAEWKPKPDLIANTIDDLL